MRGGDPEDISICFQALKVSVELMTPKPNPCSHCHLFHTSYVHDSVQASWRIQDKYMIRSVFPQSSQSAWGDVSNLSEMRREH